METKHLVSSYRSIQAKSKGVSDRREGLGVQKSRCESKICGRGPEQSPGDRAQRLSRGRVGKSSLPRAACLRSGRKEERVTCCLKYAPEGAWGSSELSGDFFSHPVLTKSPVPEAAICKLQLCVVVDILHSWKFLELSKAGWGLLGAKT